MSSGQENSWIDNEASFLFLPYEEDTHNSEEEPESPNDEFDQYTDIALPRTFCFLVPPDVVCVLPKARTPSTGCTIRSLSHHLSLLPGIGEVSARWNALAGGVVRERQAGDVLNVLAIPFPFVITGLCFSRSQGLSNVDKPWGYFGIDQKWLRSDDIPAASLKVEIAKFIVDIVREATRDVGAVDAIVLPELALDYECYEEILNVLGRVLRTDRAVFFISGVKSIDDEKRPRNYVVTSVLQSGLDGEQYLYRTAQSKHHRWRLNRDQIVTYSIGDALDPNCLWWEDIAVDERQIHFHQFCDGGCFTTLVCEDLARVDPCQSVIRAVGPQPRVCIAYGWTATTEPMACAVRHRPCGRPRIIGPDTDLSWSRRTVVSTRQSALKVHCPLERFIRSDS